MSKKTSIKRSFAILLSVVLVLGILPSELVRAAEQTTKSVPDSGVQEPEEITYERIDIYTAEDLMAFSDQCYVDAWSKNKSVTLKADIDLSEVSDFHAIPVFDGIFDGEGHTISGFYHTGAGYVTGFFRYIQGNGLVKDLTLKGQIEGDDEEECIGGLCGVNYGTIRGCAFQGMVKGRDTIGGIVGINESSGTISNCTVRGRISGNYSTGGIVGINHGVINNCTNRAGINDNTEWVEEDDELGTGIFFSISVTDEETQVYSGVDAGGIAGYSDGVLSRCSNAGIVGYEHTGYNIGGIVGRQSGVVSLCTNNGEVYGRKDVGGIVGQMEPFIEINEAESLRNAINKLHDVIDKTLDDIKLTKNVLKEDVDSLQSYAENAVDTGDALVTQLSDFVDDNMDQVNAVSDRIEHVLDMFPNITDSVNAALDEFSVFNGIIDDLVDDIDILSGSFSTTQYRRISLVTTVGGSLSCDQTEPAEGDTVTVTVSPDENYIMKSKSFRVQDKNGKKISAQDSGNGSYTFVMPKNNVLVTAEFEHTGTFQSTGITGADTIKGVANDDAIKEEEVPKEVGAPDIKEPAQEPEKEEDTVKEEEKIETIEKEDAATEIRQEDTAAEDAEAAISGGDSADSLQSNPQDTEQIQNPSTETMTQETESVQESSSSQSSDATVSTALVILTSNLGGRASYTCNPQGVVTLTITPYEGYALNGNPTVKDSKNKKIPISKNKADSLVYTFNISKSVQPCTVKITFKRQNKGEAAQTALGDLQVSLDDLSDSMEEINKSIKTIKSIVQNEDGTMKRFSSLTAAEREAVNAEILKLADALSASSASVSSVMSALSSLSNVLSTYDLSGTLSKVKKDIDNATDALQRVINSFKAASNSVRDIVNYLNAQPDIEFVKLGDDFDATKEELHDQLKGISNSLSSLSDNASVYSDIVNEDLRAVNDQLNVVFNLLADTMSDLNELDLEKYYEDDIDDETLAELTTGRTDICTNKGIVNGDINVGGIAGSMSIDSEDLEGNAAGSVAFELGSKFITRCAITESVNEGYVTAKKNGAGGIVGYMNHGIVADSEGYGSIESTEGDYVGGICGESHTIIKRCYALCSVTGKKNIGGIAGYAQTLKNCYAMPDIAAESGRMGAIAGQIKGYEEVEDTDDVVNVSDNYYVGDDVYGIDNISYTGIAEPITYRELLTVEKLPTQFRHLKVIYKIEDTYLGMEEVTYGTPLTALNYPEIPQKDGYYGVWEDVTGKTMSGTLLVEAQYKENVTVVQSDGGETADAGDHKKPYALVNDAFTENTVLNAVISDIAPPDNAARRDYVVYEVSLENGGIGETDSFAIRLLNPYEDAAVWGYRNGAWTKLESKVRGQYLQVDMIGTNEVFCLVDERADLVLIMCGAAAGAVVLALVVLLLKGGKKRRKNKKGKNIQNS